MGEYFESKQERLAEIKGSEDVHTCVHTYVRTCINKCMCVYVYIYIYIYNTYLHTVLLRRYIYSIIWIIPEQYIVH